jgi:hypothetical protein
MRVIQLRACILLLLLLLLSPVPATCVILQLCEQAVDTRGPGTVCIIANYLFPQVSKRDVIVLTKHTAADVCPSG